MIRRAAAILLALGPACAQAEERAFPWELRLEGAHDSLDQGRDDWREAVAQLAWRPRKSLTLLGGARETERFARKDREGFAGAYLPLGGSGGTLHLEGTASDTHRVLPRWVALAELAQPLGQGWVATGGLKASRFSSGSSRTLLAGLERYFGDYRVGYNLYVSRPEGGAWSPAHRLSASWYRGELTSVTVSAARGREVENILPAGLLASNVRSASISGGFELTPSLGLTFEWASVRQGDLYTRRSARFGTRLLF